MREFEFLKPVNLAEVLVWLEEKDAVVVAGGTDYVVDLYNGNQSPPEVVIDIHNLEELNQIFISDNKVLHVGSCCTFTTIAKNELVKKYATSLYQAANVVGSPQIRSLGTLGGNLANASVAADSIAPIISLNSRICLKSTNGERTIDARDFFSSDRNSFIKKNEIIVGVDIPLNEEQYSTYVKLGKRNALAIVVIGLAMSIEIDKTGFCRKANVVVNALSPLPTRLTKIEELLIGKRYCEEIWKKTLPLFSDAVYTLIPSRASMSYKTESIKGVAKEAFRNLQSIIDSTAVFNEV